MRNRKDKKATAKLPVKTGAMDAVSVYRHVRTPLFVASRSNLDSADDSVFRSDPFLQTARVQYIHKSDYTVETYTVGKCTTLSEYSSGVSNNVHRLVWVPPVIIKNPDNGSTKGRIEGDQRGVFADIGATRITFKNVMKQPVKIVINSPRGRISDPANCYVRRFKREIEIAPGKVRWFNCSWGDKANIFTPMALAIDIHEQAPKDPVQGFAIADYVIVVPDVDEMSGKTAATLSNQSAVEIKVQQRYIATATYSGYGASPAIVYVTRKPFAVVKLAKLYEMMYENPIVLTGSLPAGACVKSVAGRLAIFDGEDSYKMPEYEGRVLVLHGAPGYWKVVNGDVVLWDPVKGVLDVLTDPITVAPGCPWQVLPSQATVSFSDVLSWLTTVTEILSIVASFL